MGMALYGIIDTFDYSMHYIRNMVILTTKEKLEFGDGSR